MVKIADLYLPEGFFTTTLSSDINASTTTIPLTTVPSDVTKGYLVIEPSSSTKREVIHFTSVGASSVTAADDTTDANDATGRGCKGSITTGANTSHDQGVTVIIAATYQYWKRLYDKLTGGDTTVLVDSNGNEILKTDSASSAVNEITLKNAATGNGPEVQATGGDSNIDLNLVPKGTGVIKAKTTAVFQVVASDTDVSTGDGKFFFRVPKELDGMDLVDCEATVYTAGTTNTTDIQIRNKTDSVDMLSTKLTIDSGETDSSTAATPAVIDTDNDDVAEADVLAIDIDQVSDTAPKGLVISLTFK